MTESGEDNEYSDQCKKQMVGALGLLTQISHIKLAVEGLALKTDSLESKVDSNKLSADKEISYLKTEIHGLKISLNDNTKSLDENSVLLREIKTDYLDPISEAKKRWLKLSYIAIPFLVVTSITMLFSGDNSLAVGILKAILK